MKSSRSRTASLVILISLRRVSNRLTWRPHSVDEGAVPFTKPRKGGRDFFEAMAALVAASSAGGKWLGLSGVDGSRFDALRLRCADADACAFTLDTYLALEEASAERHELVSPGVWQPTMVRAVSAALLLESIGVELTLRDIYDGVALVG